MKVLVVVSCRQGRDVLRARYKFGMVNASQAASFKTQPERKKKMVYINEDGTARSTNDYGGVQFGCQPYAPQRYYASEYDRGYDAGKTAVGIGMVGLGAAIAYLILKGVEND